MDLAKKKCVPCEEKTTGLSRSGSRELIKETPGWDFDIEANKIIREFKFKDFAKALAFVNKVGEVAEDEGHHPDIKLSYGKVLIEIWTHSINGLSENDFILASKINKLTNE